MFSGQVTAQILDQEQTIINGTQFLNGRSWQQFTPRGKQQQHIDVHIGCFFGGSNPIILTIEKPLGTAIFSTSKSAVDVPNQLTDWSRFYVNAKLTVGEVYYLVLDAPPGSEYAWSFGTGDPYPNGISSIGINEDFCFRTFVEKTKTIKTPLIRFLENHPQMFPFLQLLLNLQY
jgi:hypothetical protein